MLIGDKNKYDVSIVHIGVNTAGTTEFYEDIDAEQIEVLAALADDYSYRRTFRTCFAHSINDIGAIEYVITEWTPDNTSPKMVIITSSGQMMIDDHPYKMRNAEEFTEKAADIFSK